MFFAKSWILLIKFFEMPRSVSKSLFFAALFVEGTLHTLTAPKGAGDGWVPQVDGLTRGCHLHLKMGGGQIPLISNFHDDR